MPRCLSCLKNCGCFFLFISCNNVVQLSYHLLGIDHLYSHTEVFGNELTTFVHLHVDYHLYCLSACLLAANIHNIHFVLRSFVGMANSYDRADLRKKLQKKY